MKREKTYSLKCAAKEDSNQLAHQRSLIRVFVISKKKVGILGFPKKSLTAQSGPKVIKLFSCSTQLSMKFSLAINMKMPTVVGIFIFISREIFRLSNI